MESGSILEAVSPFDFQAVSRDLGKDSHDFWSASVFESLVFHEWTRGQRWQLRCTGPPRCGKTTFAAATVEKLKQANGEKDAVIVLFLAFIESSVLQNCGMNEAIWRCIFRQLLELQLSVDAESSTVLGCSTGLPLTLDAGSSLDVVTLTELVKAQCQRFHKTFIILDDLDHMAEIDEKVFMSQLRACGINYIMSIGSPQTNLFPRDELRCDECREGPEILLWLDCELCDRSLCGTCVEQGRECQHLSQSDLTVEVNIEAGFSQVEGFVQQCLITGKVGMDLWDNLTNLIMNKSQDSFALARPCMADISEGLTVEDMTMTSTRLPTYHSRYFRLALWRLKNQKNQADASLALTALAVVSLTGSAPITYQELRSILLYVDPQCRRYGGSFDRKRISRVTQGWLKINTYVHGPVSLFVSPAQIYLRDECPGFYSQTLYDGHSILPYGRDLALLCLDAVLKIPRRFHESGDTLDQIRLSLRTQTPFIQYALKTWHLHFQNFSTQKTTEAARRFLCQYQQSVQLQCIHLLFAETRGQAISDKMHYAAHAGLSKLMEDFIEQDLNVNVVDTFTGQTPAITACKAGNIDIVRRLIDAKADISWPCQHGHNLLWHAVHKGDVESVNRILSIEHQDPVPVHSRTGDSILSLAVAMFAKEPQEEYQSLFQPRSTILNMLLRRKDVDFGVFKQGKTIIHTAADYAHLPTLKALFARRQCRKWKDCTEEGGVRRTALMNIISSYEAPETGRLDAFRFLIEQGANPWVKDARGRTTLHYAAMDDADNDILHDLVHIKTANLNERDDAGWTALHTAYAHNCSGAVQILIDAKVDETQRNLQGQTALELSPLPEDVVQVSLHDILTTTTAAAATSDRRSTLLRTDPTGSTVLHLAAQYDPDGRCFESLLAFPEIDVNATDFSGRTALHLMLERHFCDPRNRALRNNIQALLRRSDIQLEIVDDYGERALDLALRRSTPNNFVAVCDMLELNTNFLHPPTAECITNLFVYAIRKRKLPSVTLVRKLIDAGGADIWKRFPVTESRQEREAWEEAQARGEQGKETLRLLREEEEKVVAGLKDKIEREAPSHFDRMLNRISTGLLC